MRYSNIKTVQSTGIGLERSCAECLERIERTKHGPNFCPNCGHKFRWIPDSISPEKLVELLNANIDVLCGGKDEQQSGSPDLYIGPGPYTVSIVRSTDGGVLCTAGQTYEKEAEAVQAALGMARTANQHVDPDCIRHWTTSKKEHMIDFGSHTVYARITSERSE